MVGAMGDDMGVGLGCGIVPWEVSWAMPWHAKFPMVDAMRYSIGPCTPHGKCHERCHGVLRFHGQCHAVAEVRWRAKVPIGSATGCSIDLPHG